MNRECMNVVYASNDGYARHLGTSSMSLLDTNRDFEEIAVYVLTLGFRRKIRRGFGKSQSILGGSLFF